LLRGDYGVLNALGRERHKRIDAIPYVRESRREWRQADPDQIGAAKVDDDVALDQRCAQLVRVSVGHGHVRASS
jgi:hypothetical protein